MSSNTRDVNFDESLETTAAKVDARIEAIRREGIRAYVAQLRELRERFVEKAGGVTATAGQIQQRIEQAEESLDRPVHYAAGQALGPNVEDKTAAEMRDEIAELIDECSRTALRTEVAILERQKQRFVSEGYGASVRAVNQINERISEVERMAQRS